MKGAGSVKLSEMVSSYFWNLQAAIAVERVNEMKANKTANVYATACRSYHKQIAENPLYENLPLWVQQDIKKGYDFVCDNL